ncbi:hypothetical protein [Paenibacillus sp. SI8]|uniref:hypothetical protein n=1 Tax=unclassified Paenibacillus TaxID=185978 RepID=UPI003465698F
MIIWKGAGILTIPIAVIMVIAAMGIASIFTDQVSNSTNEHIYVGIGFLLSAVPIWYAGKYFNRNKNNIYLEVKSGRQMQLGYQHSLFFIPMEYCSIPAVLIGIITIFMVK